MPTMIRSMTDADNKMSVNLHENGKQQESQSVARSSIINSFVAASGTLIIILCSRLDTCSRVLCVSPRSLALLVSRCSLPDFSPALSCPQFSNRTFYNFLRCLYKVVTCPYSQHLASHANFSSIIVLLKKTTILERLENTLQGVTRYIINWFSVYQYFIEAGITLQLWTFISPNLSLISSLTPHCTRERCPVSLFSRNSRLRSQHPVQICGALEKLLQFAVIRPSEAPDSLATLAKFGVRALNSGKLADSWYYLSSVSCLVIMRPGARSRLLPRGLRRIILHGGENVSEGLQFAFFIRWKMQCL